MWADLAAAYAPLGALHELFVLGGPVVKWIFLAALVLWFLIIERYWYFAFVHPGRVKAMRAEWDARDTRRTWTARRIRDAMISEMNGAMSSGVMLMRVIIPICPLLGLVGTIHGMLEVFDVMALKGGVDARAMAKGVSHAMVATLTGLGVSISGMFFVNRFRARVRHQTEWLADQLSYQ